jgi:hypothetical protein
MDGIHLAEDMDQWWAIASTVMSLRALQNTGNFMTS